MCRRVGLLLWYRMPTAAGVTVLRGFLPLGPAVAATLRRTSSTGAGIAATSHVHEIARRRRSRWNARRNS